MALRHPDFFLVGAPKCGTTALSEYLRQHRAVFMSTPKEPHYFAHDFPHYKAEVPDLDTYLALFATATDSHLACCEASVWYLYSRRAIAAIREFAPAARLLVMLRNPIELAYSLHSQLLWTLDEDEVDFNRAWALQAARAAGRNLPARCREPAFLQYGAVARLGEQVERLFATFPPEQVMTVFHEDFAAQPAACYAGVLAFLGVPHDGRSEFSRVNENKRHGRSGLAPLLLRPPSPLVAGYKSLKRALGFRGLGLQRGLLRLTSETGRRPPLAPKLRAELVAYFADDVAHLGRLTGRDLSHWLAPSPESREAANDA